MNISYHPRRQLSNNSLLLTGCLIPFTITIIFANFIFCETFFLIQQYILQNQKRNQLANSTLKGKDAIWQLYDRCNHHEKIKK